MHKIPLYDTMHARGATFARKRAQQQNKTAQHLYSDHPPNTRYQHHSMARHSAPENIEIKKLACEEEGDGMHPTKCATHRSYCVVAPRERIPLELCIIGWPCRSRSSYIKSSIRSGLTPPQRHSGCRSACSSARPSSCGTCSCATSCGTSWMPTCRAHRCTTLEQQLATLRI